MCYSLHQLLGDCLIKYIRKEVATVLKRELAGALKQKSLNKKARAQIADRAASRIARRIESWNIVCTEHPGVRWVDRRKKDHVKIGVSIVGKSLCELIDGAIRRSLAEALAVRIRNGLKGGARKHRTWSTATEATQALAVSFAMDLTEWVCRYNPRAGYCQWYNERTGEWYGVCLCGIEGGK